ncbi:hypothetical protein CY34DRAFT_407578 [Suillus luteus UH-Slu-Lm8-n1]|uniref:Uncharacterized protein n=1 Tax=Suillus luteus UH-Slu-Lm8-n1 TaxID=930992 RepID=A0A0D0AUU2_9AGAM|nr:hypothetical protein CY34DRAFT_407578 [Suillus luteus UH-Slu-Lm8-n1]
MTNPTSWRTWQAEPSAWCRDIPTFLLSTSTSAPKTRIVLPRQPRHLPLQVRLQPARNNVGPSSASRCTNIRVVQLNGMSRRVSITYPSRPH